VDEKLERLRRLLLMRVQTVVEEAGAHHQHRPGCSSETCPTVCTERLLWRTNEEFVVCSRRWRAPPVQLARIGLLRGLLLSGNVVARMLRRNLSARHWLRILNGVAA
jgi:hypothetical protein